MKQSTLYVLVSRLDNKTRVPIPNVFRSATAAALFALVHDYHANVAPASGDLFGHIDADPS